MSKLTKTLLVIVLLLALIVGGMIAMILLRSDGADWQEQYDMGMRFLMEGRYEEAILAFTAALEIEPNRAEIYLARADAYAGIGDWEAAQRDYSTAAELDPDLEQEVMRRLEELVRQQFQTEPVQTEPAETTQVLTTVPTETEPPATETAGSVYHTGSLMLAKIEIFGNGQLSETRTCSYREDKQISRVAYRYYNDEQLVASHQNVYSYDDSGMPLAIRNSSDPGNAVEYFYSGGYLTGYRSNEYMGDYVNTTDYDYTLDDAGRITQIISRENDNGIWLNAKNAYDAQGRLVFQEADSRYGDMYSSRTYSIDYCYTNAALITGTEFYVNRPYESKYLQFDDPVLPIQQRFNLLEDYQVHTDDSGYVTHVTDGDGEFVYRFTYANPEDTMEGQLKFSDLPDSYILTSGAGGWMTSLELAADGSFNGHFSDSNMGESGPGHMGTVYQCKFTGRFSQPEQINEFTYRMTLESLEKLTPAGEAYIENETKFVAAEPYGMEEDTVYYLFLPGAPSGVMPEDVYNWVNMLYGYGGGMDTVYVIAGENAQLPFMGELE